MSQQGSRPAWQSQVARNWQQIGFFAGANPLVGIAQIRWATGQEYSLASDRPQTLAKCGKIDQMELFDGMISYR